MNNLNSRLCSGTPDARCRRYIAPVRVIRHRQPQEHDELLLHTKPEVQSYGYPGQPLTKISPGGEVLLDFGCELAGGVRIITSANDCRISTVRITFGESVSEAIGNPNQDHAIHQTVLQLPPTGMTEYGNTGFRFLRLEVPPEAERPLELIGVCAVATYRDLEYIGAFQCDDERLNRIWEVGAKTVHWCMQDYIYDGIKRDRLVWMGDFYPEMRTIAALFSDTEAVESSLDFVIAHTPEGEWINGISSYSIWWLICQYEWFRLRGNQAYLNSHRGAIHRIVAQLARYIAGDGAERLDGMRFLDWLSYEDTGAVHAGLHGLMSWGFHSAVALGKALQDAELERFARTTLQRLNAFRPTLPRSSKSAAAMLALGGLEEARTVNQKVLAVDPLANLSVFGANFVLEARQRAGDLAGALELTRAYWGGMLDAGATTFWEDFDLGWLTNAGRIDELPQAGKADLHADFGKHCYQGLRHSLCHGWGGGVTAFLSDHLLGIQPFTPGFASVRIAPESAGLHHIHGAIPTPFGKIELEGEAGRYQCRLPAGIQVAEALPEVEVISR